MRTDPTRRLHGRTAGAALASAALASILVLGVGTAPAAAAQGYRITIAVAPDPDVSGDPLTMVGTLSDTQGHPVQGVQLELYHRVAPTPFFSPVQRARTQAGGFYQINRAEGVVISNREWYIVARAPDGRVLARSRTVRERVFAELTLNTSAPSAETGQPVTFSGAVAPRHDGERVILQRQQGENGNSWHRIGVGVIEADGAFSIQHTFRRPSEAGPATIRAVLPGDARNVRSYSEPVTITITQAENPQLTLSASAPAIVVGEAVTLSGRLAASGGGSAEGQSVTLYAHTHGHAAVPIATTVTGSQGAFSFRTAPANNTDYEVKAPGVASATVYLGVRDALTAGPSTTSGTVGERITVAGVVVPVHVGHVVYLQLRNHAGHYQTIQLAFVGAGSTYVFHHQLQSAGEKEYRVYIPGGPENIGAASPPFTVDVAPATALPQLEPTPTPEA